MSEGRTKTFLEFIEEKPDLKFFFTGGKGGVGKTIAAAGIAYYYASQGKKTLLASLNPVHSLSSIFEQELWGGDIKKVEGVEHLYAVEVDIKDTVEQYKKQLSERLRWFLKWADIPVKADDFIEIAATNPAFEESAMFDSMLDVMLKEGGNYDKIVFDCAAVANAVRLLGLSKIYELWLSRMIKSREEALSLRVRLSFRKDKVLEEIKKDPMMADLLNMRKRMQEAKKVLNNPDVTAFFFVTIPLALPIAVVKRFINMVKGFDIPIGGVFVNMVIPEAVVKGRVTEYMINKYEEQQNYLSIIKRDLWPLVRAEIPLFPTEIVGIDMIAKVAEAIVNWKPQS
ncbi:MAG: ArsA family ATPase [Candidatus Baldrarchaeia archaeon]|mgnify:FL=1